MPIDDDDDNENSSHFFLDEACWEILFIRGKYNSERIHNE